MAVAVGQAAPDEEQKSFHRALRSNLGLIAVWMGHAHFVFRASEKLRSKMPRFIITIVGLFACTLFFCCPDSQVQRFNFLQIGRQRNLIYAVFSAFVALLYFSLIRRVSLWLEPYVPPEASAQYSYSFPSYFLSRCSV